MFSFCFSFVHFPKSSFTRIAPIATLMPCYQNNFTFVRQRHSYTHETKAFWMEFKHFPKRLNCVFYYFLLLWCVWRINNNVIPCFISSETNWDHFLFFSVYHRQNKENKNLKRFMLEQSRILLFKFLEKRKQQKIENWVSAHVFGYLLSNRMIMEIFTLNLFSLLCFN